VQKVWTEREEQLMRELYPDALTEELVPLFGCPVPIIYSKARRMGIGKSQAFQDSPGASRLRRGDEVGKAHRFPKGHVPANKGLRRPGYAPGGMAETQFKPGRRPRIAVGGHRVDCEGFLMRRVSDTGYNDWRYEHRLLWEEANGPIPKGHKLAFRDCDRKHVVLDNLELVTDAEMMRRNSFRNNYSPEIVEVIDLRRQLTRAIRRRERAEEQDAGPERPPVRDAGSVEGRREANGS
jgi:hypothetical protein